VLHTRHIDRNVRLNRVNAKLRGIELRGNRRARVDDWSTQRLRTSSNRMERRNRVLRREAREAREAAQARSAAMVAPVVGGGSAPAGLEAIAACESGGNPSAVSADGTYRGKYQFDQQTWQSVGGSGDPAAAPEAEQDARAAALAAQRGSNPWPTCG
jgi:hypothetical protein